jgi:D-beta-D-heptose 7-phosphate kinase/D-beta-D-heptose 1-phosphate adenosyltransferase
LSELRHLLPLIERLGTAVVACAGDLILDHFIYGRVNRISPEAPIPVIRIDSQRSMLGGVGNVVRNLSSLGCSIQLFSATGTDTAGFEIAALLHDIPRCQSFIHEESGRQTPVKTRYVAHGQQLLRADHETTQALGAAAFARITRDFKATVAGCAVVFLSDYAKGTLNGAHAGEFIRIARAAGKPVVVDPKGLDFTRYRGATLIKPNLTELAEATGMPVSDTAAQNTASGKLLDITGAEFVLLTRGPGGMLLTARNGPPREFPARAREVYDVSGAGDTVGSVIAAALGSGAGIADAVDLANIAAGIVVGKVGTAVVEPTELVHEVELRSVVLSREKVLVRGEAIQRSARWKHMGLRVGLIQGSFDLLSPETITLLEHMRSQCDRLVVGLESDLMVSRHGRAAVRDQNARARMLAALISVDAVVVVEENQAQLIADLQPTIWKQCIDGAM